MSKLWRSNQDRNGKLRRRRLEFNAIMYNVRKNKERFTARLQRRIVKVGNCLCYRGTLDQKGYARLNLSYKPEGATQRRIVTIGAHRLFLIMKLGRPIARSHEAGHAEECKHRTCVAHLREEHYRLNAVTNAKHLAYKLAA